MRHLRQQIMRRIRRMAAIQPEILIHGIRAALILISHTRQLQPVGGVIRAIARQRPIAFGLREAILVVQGVVEQCVHVYVPDDGVFVFLGEMRRHGF